MRSLIVILFLGPFLLLPETHANPVNGEVEQSEHAKSLLKSDWLIELIRQLLNMTVSELLKIIYNTTIGVHEFALQAVEELKKLLELLNPEIKEAVEKIITESFDSAFEMIQPILAQMLEILPIISKMNISDYISDLIESILGITLDELLRNITLTFGGLNKILVRTTKDLETIALESDEDTAEIIKTISDENVKMAKKLLGPLLDNLRKLFPEDIAI